MSDFNRNDDAYNRDRDLRVVQKDNDSGLGLMAGIAVVVLLLLGGLLFYFNPGAVRTADNSGSITSADSSASAPQRSPMTPAAPSGSATAPSAKPAPITPPASAPAR